jgi:hypothetical protein
MKTAVALLGVFGAGILLGFALRGGGDRAGAPVEVMNRSAASAPASAATPTARLGEAVASRADQPGGDPAPPSTPESSLVPVALRDALAALPAPAVERGEAAVVGTVRSERGEPLEGVLVRAEPVLDGASTRRSSSRGRAGKTLEEDVVDLVMEHRQREARRGEARTDAQVLA